MSDKVIKVLDEAQKLVGGNSNFSLESLPWNTKLWVLALSEVMDKRLAELQGEIELLNTNLKMSELKQKRRELL